MCRYLPREVDPLVYNMSVEDPGDITFNQIGGLGEQVRELREVCHTFHASKPSQHLHVVVVLNVQV
jgi:ATP-dependent 26S proteasome regulatory subunit